jgi:uncharacterized protein YlaN (UPF0358 family)
MTLNAVETRKRAILEHLAETQDEVILLQIENLLRPSIDIWDELSDSQKASIKLGVEALKNGQKVGFEEFMAKYRSRQA